MEDALRLNINYGAVIRRRLPLSLAVGLVLAVVTVVLALGLPSYYKSRAVVLIEAQEIPQDLVRSLVTSYADQRLQIIAQRVLTNSNLSSIIEKNELYTGERRRDPLEVVLERMRKDVTVAPISADVVDPKQGRPVQATIAFELSYENKSPQLAQKVANEIVSLFLNENLKQRSETSAETLEFLTAESEKLRTTVAELESKLAKFKQGNVESLPELTSLNLDLMNRTDQQITQIDTQIQSLQQQRVYLSSELAQQKPKTILISETGERILSPADRLKILESEFVPLAARYGASHPDVVAKRKEIESLRGQAGGGSDAGELALKLTQAQTAYAEAAKKYSADHPDVKRMAREVDALRAQVDAANRSGPVAVTSTEPPDNPAYVELQARLQATDTDIRSLNGQKAELRAKLANLEARITKTPEVEREYRMLTRDYDTAQLKYQEVLAKRQEAELASNMESKQRGERFTLIEPPAVPEEPSKPNRLAIFVFGIFLALAASGGAGVLAESLDDRVYGRSGVVRALGVMPLAVIPQIDTAASRSQGRRRFGYVVGALLVALLIALAIVHFVVGPLDVLFYRALRVLGGG